MTKVSRNSDIHIYNLNNTRIEKAESRKQKAERHLKHLLSKCATRNTHGGKSFRAKQKSLNFQIENTQKRINLLSQEILKLKNINKKINNSAVNKNTLYEKINKNVLNIINYNVNIREAKSPQQKFHLWMKHFVHPQQETGKHLLQWLYCEPSSNTIKSYTEFVELSNSIEKYGYKITETPNKNEFKAALKERSRKESLRKKDIDQLQLAQKVFKKWNPGVTTFSNKQKPLY